MAEITCYLYIPVNNYNTDNILLLLCAWKSESGGETDLWKRIPKSNCLWKWRRTIL